MSQFNVQIQGLNEVIARYKNFNQELENKLQTAMNKFAFNTANDARRFAPVDEGFLKGSISPVTKRLQVEIVVNADYAAFVEFGTRQFAAKYVSSLPQDWQQFASQFRGKGGGTFADLVRRLTEWVHRKGLGSGFTGKIGVAGTYSLKSRKRTGNKSSQADQDRQAAYMIALKILRNGVKPQPFLYPAFAKNIIVFEADLKQLFKAA